MSSQRASKFALTAFSLLLGACSFQFQAGMSANGGANRRQAAQPTRATTPPPAKATATAPAGTAKPPVVAPTVEAPRITAKNVFGNPSIGAFKGNAYVIPNTTTTMPDLSKLVPFASLVTDSFIVQTQNFTEGFPGVLMQDEWFAIRFDGFFDIQKDDTYTFKLTSDDGAILYIDGVKVVDNDGVHATKAASAAKALKVGKHALRLDYFQGARGPVALSLAFSDATSEPRPLVGIR